MDNEEDKLLYKANERSENNEEELQQSECEAKKTRNNYCKAKERSGKLERKKTHYQISSLLKNRESLSLKAETERTLTSSSVNWFQCVTALVVKKCNR